jgi:hypothetical protein
MDFINHTPYPAKLLTGSSGNKEIIGIAVCKVTYQVGESTLIPVNTEDAWPIFNKPYVFEGTQLMPETDFRKKGIDIIVFGKAVAQGEKPVSSLRVAVECGEVRHETIIFGNRTWLSTDDGLKPSEPEPFLTLPLTNNLVFGGSAKLQDTQVVHSVNPEGRGFLLEKKAAEGTLLPNIEDPDSLIVNWQDAPRPACWFKPDGILRPKDAEDVHPEALPIAIMQSMFNQAVPELIAEPEKIGNTLRLTGFSKDGDLIFPVPAIRGPFVDVQAGEIKGRFPATLSTLIILPDEEVIIATYTALFRYLIQPFEKRSAILNWPYATPALKADRKEDTHV